MPYVTVGKEKFRRHRALLRRPRRGATRILPDPRISIKQGLRGRSKIPVATGCGIQRSITYDRRGFAQVPSQPTGGYNYDTFTEDLHKAESSI